MDYKKKYLKYKEKYIELKKSLEGGKYSGVFNEIRNYLIDERSITSTLSRGKYDDTKLEELFPLEFIFKKLDFPAEQNPGQIKYSKLNQVIDKLLNSEIYDDIYLDIAKKKLGGVYTHTDLNKFYTELAIVFDKIKTKKSFDITNEKNKYVLIYAVINCNKLLVKKLLDLGMNPLKKEKNVKGGITDPEYNALDYAIDLCNFRPLQRDFCVQSHTETDDQKLYFKDYLEIIDMILDKSKFTEIIYHTQTKSSHTNYLEAIISHGNSQLEEDPKGTQIVGKLIDKLLLLPSQEDIFVSSSSYVSRPFINAFNKNYFKICKTLLDKKDFVGKADIDEMKKSIDRNFDKINIKIDDFINLLNTIQIQTESESKELKTYIKQKYSEKINSTLSTESTKYSKDLLECQTPKSGELKPKYFTNKQNYNTLCANFKKII